MQENFAPDECLNSGAQKCGQDEECRILQLAGDTLRLKSRRLGKSKRSASMEMELQQIADSPGCAKFSVV
jgi:hypothetical protein